MYFRIGASQVHIAGTMHWVPEGRALADWVLPAYQQSTALYLEHDKSPEAEARDTYYADGQSMEQRLPPDVWAQIKAAWPATAPPLTTQRPMAIATTIAAVGVQRSPGVEPTLIDRARADSRRLQYLETLEESSALLDRVPDSCWAVYFDSFFRYRATTPGQHETMYEAWIEGDPQASILTSMYSHVPPIRQAIYASRNRLWLPRILNLLRAPIPTLVLVGAGHLGGPGGLLTLLNQLGYTVTRTKTGEYGGARR